jgi:DNA-binding MarR family transcriptional regulator
MCNYIGCIFAAMDAKIATPNFDKVNPAECINAKLRKLQRKVAALYEARLRPFGLEGSMLAILFLVGKLPGINQKTVADKLVLDPSTMSRDAKKLVKRGVLRVTKGEDPRNSELALTNEGYELLEQVSPIWEAMHHKVSELFGRFSIQQLDMMTEAINQNINELKA